MYTCVFERFADGQVWRVEPQTVQRQRCLHGKISTQYRGRGACMARSARMIPLTQQPPCANALQSSLVLFPYGGGYLRHLQDPVRRKPNMAGFSTDLEQVLAHRPQVKILRTNLEQVLAQVKDDRTRAAADDDDNEDATVAPAGPAPFLDDAQSCCGSTDGDDDEEDDANSHHHKETRQGTMEGRWLTVAAGCAVVKDKDEEDCAGTVGGSESRRLCRNCGKEESCVLILPCRHLCLCTVCGSTLHTCPVCKSFKNASVHVNMS